MSRVLHQGIVRFPLQHHDPSFAVQSRKHVECVRLGDGGPGSSVGDDGEMIAEEDTRGDLLCGRIWDAGRVNGSGFNRGRDMPGWTLCMPTIALGRSGGGAGGPAWEVLASGPGANGGNGLKWDGGRGVWTTGYRSVPATTISTIGGRRQAFSRFFQPTARSPGGGSINPGDRVASWVSSTAQSGYHSGSGPSVVSALPVQKKGSNGRDVADTRFEASFQVRPDWDSSTPGGLRGIGLAGTDEFSQQNLWLQTDGRLLAPAYAGDPRSGSLVCDMTSGGEIDAQAPAGLGGRQAFLQTMVRVVRMPYSIDKIPHAPGNSNAWVMSNAEAGGTAGHGLVFGKAQNEQDTPDRAGGRKPVVTVSSYEATEIMRSAQFMAMRAGALAAGKGFDSAAAVTQIISSRTGIPQSGLFYPTVQNQAPVGASFKESNDFSGGRPVVAMMGHEAGGPLSPGFGKGDVHRLGIDQDGNPINSGQLSVKALFSRNIAQSGPLRFSRILYPRGVAEASFGFRHRVYCSWRKNIPHSHPTGTKQGKWDWWVQVPWIIIEEPEPPYIPPPPETPPPDTPTTPPADTPTTPGPRPSGLPPITGVPFGNGGGDPLGKGVRDRTGLGSGVQDAGIAFWGSTGLSSTIHYPQSMHARNPDFRFSMRQPDGAKEAEAKRRPGVMRTEAFGKEPSGRWLHETKPGRGRIAGGTSLGGVMDMPPNFDLFNFNGKTTATAPTVSGDFYRGQVPGVWAAAGYPDTATGGMTDGSFRHGLDDSDGFWKMSLQSSGVWAPVLSVDPSSRSVKSGSDLIVNDASKGIVLQSPDGDYHRITVSNASVLTVTDLGSTAP